MQTMPASECANHYTATEKAISSGGLALPTKNGCGTMTVMNMEQYERLTGGVEAMLDAADRQAESSTIRYSHEEVFSGLREELCRGRAESADVCQDGRGIVESKQSSEEDD